MNQNGVEGKDPEGDQASDSILPRSRRPRGFFLRAEARRQNDNGGNARRQNDNGGEGRR